MAPATVTNDPDVGKTLEQINAAIKSNDVAVGPAGARGQKRAYCTRADVIDDIRQKFQKLTEKDSEFVD